MSENNERPPFKFITFEGGEGAGKTTLIDEVAAMLEARGLSIVKTREPGGTPFGNQMRSWLLDHRSDITIGAKAELLLFLSARAQHIEEVIEPAIKAGKIVLCDRFNDSTVAYQGAGRFLGVPLVRSLCDLVCGPIVPDLTFYLDVDPLIGLVRARGTLKENATVGQLDRIESEKLEFHQRVRSAFQLMAKEESQRFRWIDANQSKKSVIDAALNVLMF